MKCYYHVLSNTSAPTKIVTDTFFQFFFLWSERSMSKESFEVKKSSIRLNPYSKRLFKVSGCYSCHVFMNSLESPPWPWPFIYNITIKWNKKQQCGLFFPKFSPKWLPQGFYSTDTNTFTSSRLKRSEYEITRA